MCVLGGGGGGGAVNCRLMRSCKPIINLVNNNGKQKSTDLLMGFVFLLTAVSSTAI